MWLVVVDIDVPGGSTVSVGSAGGGACAVGARCAPGAALSSARRPLFFKNLIDLSLVAAASALPCRAARTPASSPTPWRAKKAASSTWRRATADASSSAGCIANGPVFASPRDAMNSFAARLKKVGSDAQQHVVSQFKEARHRQQAASEKEAALGSQHDAQKVDVILLPPFPEPLLKATLRRRGSLNSRLGWLRRRRP